MHTETNKKEEEDELIQITPYGLLSLEFDDSTARKARDVLELYMRRGNVAIAIVDNELRFVNIAPANQTEN